MEAKALADAQARYEKEFTAHTAAIEKARAERDAVIRRAHRSGMTMRAIGDAVGMSHQRVAQIVWGDRRKRS